MPEPLIIDDGEDYFNLKSGGRDRPRSGSGPGGGFFSAAGGGGMAGGIMGNDPLAGLYSGMRRRMLPQVAAVTGTQAPAVTSQGATAPQFDFRGGQVYVNGQPLQAVADERRNAPSPDKPWTMPFDPNDPWAAFAGDTRNDFYGVLNRILAAAGGAGSFDPMGSQALIDMLEGKGVRDAGAAEEAARNNLAALGYDDPALGAFGAMQAREGARGQLAGTLADARIQQATSAQEYGRNLLMQQLQGVLQQYLNSQEAELQRYNESKRGGQGFDWGGALGTLGGGVLGAFLGGPQGAIAGGSIGGGALGRK